jgi:hypothetical protein
MFKNFRIIPLKDTIFVEKNFTIQKEILPTAPPPEYSGQTEESRTSHFRAFFHISVLIGRPVKFLYCNLLGGSQAEGNMREKAGPKPRKQFFPAQARNWLILLQGGKCASMNSIPRAHY